MPPPSDPIAAMGAPAAGTAATTAAAPATAPSAPTPLLAKSQPIAWWFIFKFNTATFRVCSSGATRICLSSGDVQDYGGHYGQQFVYVRSKDPTLNKGSDCLGDTMADPLGATYDEVYNGDFDYVVWNDQFYGDPAISYSYCNDASCSAPWGHSKGLLAWNDAGQGVVTQVTTPDWPGSGSKAHPRQSRGNTLSCTEDNDVLVSQHFFAPTLSESDLVKVLKALANASVVTDPTNPQIVRNGWPADVQTLVSHLGVRAISATPEVATLSSGVELISKPTRLHVPPWQFVSAELGGQWLRVASWWRYPKITSTSAAMPIGRWDAALGARGAVEIATSAQWQGTRCGTQGWGRIRFQPREDRSLHRPGCTRCDLRRYESARRTVRNQLRP